MNTLDKHYLSLQFQLNIYKKFALAFQSYFEDIMEKVHPDFRKVPSFGGDGGNDGWIKKTGTFYQVYSPVSPHKIKDSDISKKLRENFNTLKNNWGRFSEIKEYYFVYNDNFLGSYRPEEVIATLEKENPEIKFDIFVPRNLEYLVLELEDIDLIKLGFIIDSRKANEIIRKMLQMIEKEIERKNSKQALRLIKNSKNIIRNIKDETFSFELEILECKALTNIENLNEAFNKYLKLSIQYPKEQRPLLYMAAIALRKGDFKTNKQLLKQAKIINDKYWLLEIQFLLRKIYLNTIIKVTTIDESNFPSDKNIKSIYYRVYAQILLNSNKLDDAEKFIEKAIDNSPDKFNNHVIKLTIHESKLHLARKNNGKAEEFLAELDIIENQFLEYGDIGDRNKAVLKLMRMRVKYFQEKIHDYVNIAKEVLNLSFKCYLDIQLEHIIADCIQFILLPKNDFDKLLSFIKKSDVKISDRLSKILIFQFGKRDHNFKNAKQYFLEIGNKKFSNFVNALITEDLNEISIFIKDDNQFAVTLINILKKQPVLRRKILDNLSDFEFDKIEMLRLLIYRDENDIDNAFAILKNMDLSKISYLECDALLEIAHLKEAWDIEVEILNILLKKEDNEQRRLNYSLNLFNAYYQLSNYQEAINTGEKILSKKFEGEFLDDNNKEILLSQTILANLERGKVDQKYYKNASRIIKKYELKNPSFRYKIGIEGETYVLNKEYKKALKSVIEGIKIKKLLSSQEYMQLYYLLVLQISGNVRLNLNSQKVVNKNSFVKFANLSEWYFIGDDEELDALKIGVHNIKYNKIIDQKVGDKLVFDRTYDSDKSNLIIEKIFKIEQYIFFKTRENFQNISKGNLMDSVQQVEIPEIDGKIDTQYLIKFMEGLDKDRAPIFEMYCKGSIPLALLAVSEGGLLGAIGRIKNENRGFINFSLGTTSEFEKQKEIAKNIIMNDAPFYIDGSSTLFLSESGYIKQINQYLPNIRVPQSVISMLLNIAEKFNYIPNYGGTLGYSQGKLRYSNINKEEKGEIHKNIHDSLIILEKNPNNIHAVSKATKNSSPTEQKIPPELSDACILAQKNNIPILTDDYMYLYANEASTNKSIPQYFSTMALMRILLELNKINFEEFLDFFGYLSSYRFRFLTLSVDDMVKAVIGDGQIINIKTQNIRKFNFMLTLSEEYGVKFENAFNIICIFIYKLLIDNTITPEITGNIFIEILDSFPINFDKDQFGKMIIERCVDNYNREKSFLIIRVKNNIFKKKLKKLNQAIDIYTSRSKIIAQHYY